MCCVGWACFLRRMNSLRFVSFGACACICFLLVFFVLVLVMAIYAILGVNLFGPKFPCAANDARRRPVGSTTLQSPTGRGAAAGYTLERGRR